MPGILDFFGNMSPEQNQGLLAAAAQILQRSGPSRTPFTLGQAMGTGIGAYSDHQKESQDRAQQKALYDLKMRSMVGEVGDQDQARQQKSAIAEAARGAQGANGFDPDMFINKVMQFAPLQAMELRKSFAKAAPKFDAGITWVNGPDGKPVAVRTAEDGSIKQLDGLAPRDKMELENLGGRSVAINPYALQQGQTFDRTASPDARLSASTQMRGQDITARGQNMADSRAREMLAHQKQFAKAPTEFQGKSAAFGLRATEADKAISELTGKYSPAAINAKNTVGKTWLVGGALEAATNMALSDKDQRAEQAQRDFVNAVLRQESGAAIGADEFDNARRQYFPQPGDSDGVIKQKARNRQLSIQGLQSNAGRAAMTAPPAAGGGITFLGFE